MTQIRIKAEPPRPKTWRRKLVSVLVVLLVLLLVLYFTVTSALFLKKVALPALSYTLNTEVTVADAQISPFRKIVLRELKVVPHGEEPVLTVAEVRLRYSLLAILRGNFDIAEVTVDSPVVTIVEHPNRRRNLDALLQQGPASKPAPASAPRSGPLRLNIGLVSVQNATVRLSRERLGRPADTAEITGLNLTVRDLKNGGSGKFELAADLQVLQSGPTTNSLQAHAAGDLVFVLQPSLLPDSIKGNLGISIKGATGTFVELSSMAAQLNCDTTATEIKQLALHFRKGDLALGEVRVSGPFDPARLEGKVKLEVLSLDRRVLNLAGAKSGLDFGTTSLNASTDVELQNGGELVTISGRAEAAHVQLVRAGRASPTLDLRCDYAAAVNLKAQTGELRFLNLAGSQNSRPFLQSELPQALSVSWGDAATTASDARLGLTVSDWSLADWRDFLGDESIVGQASGKLQLASTEGGKKLHLDLSGGVAQLSGALGSNRLQQANLKLNVRANATELRDFKLDELNIELGGNNQPALTATAHGAAQRGGAEADLQFGLQLALTNLFAVVQVPGLTVADGNLTLKSHLQNKDAVQEIDGKLNLADLTAARGDSRWSGYGLDFDFDVLAKKNSLELQKFAGVLSAGQKVAGRIGGGGKLEIQAGAPVGRFILKISDVNQEWLRPFIEPALGNQRLASISVGAGVTVDLAEDSSLKLAADLAVTNMVVSDASKAAPGTPLRFLAQLEAVRSGAVLEINPSHLMLTPTQRATNDLLFSGKVDFSQPEAMTGKLSLSAKALDLTRYYDLFANQPTAKAVKTGSSPPATGTGAEPAALSLPVRDFACDVEIGRLYLHELDIANWRATARVLDGKVKLQPCALTVNGAPVAIDVDANLGVPGYQYQLGLKAQAVPLAPVVNTFASDRAGQLGGHLTADLNLHGAGVTGVNLQKNLTGQFQVMATNLNLSVDNVRTPIINAIINIIVNLPEYISMISGRTDGAQTVRWADEIKSKPIDVVALQGTAGSGRIELSDARVSSAAFLAQTAGGIERDPVLTNSALHFPVQLSLARPYAEKIGMVTGDTPTNSAYLALPDFLSVQGTLGNVKTEVSKTGLAVFAGKTVLGLGKEIGLATGGTAKGLVNALNGVLGQSGGATTNVGTAGTNAAPTNEKAKGLLNLFKRPK